jgi:hypothetical protein
MARWIATLVALGLAGCTSGIKVEHSADPNADFRSFKRFSWISDYPLIAPENDLLIEYRTQPIMTTARQVLTSKGYGFVADRHQADFVLSFTIGDVGGQLVQTAYPSEYRGTWYWQGAAFDPSHPVRGVAYSPGQLRVEVFDAHTKAPVWVGYARKDITGADQYNAARVLGDVVREILANFPSAA